MSRLEIHAPPNAPAQIVAAIRQAWDQPYHRTRTDRFTHACLIAHALNYRLLDNGNHLILTDQAHTPAARFEIEGLD
jgi:hypothetical protein